MQDNWSITIKGALLQQRFTTEVEDMKEPIPLSKRERIAIHILLWIVHYIVNPTNYTHQVKELQDKIDEELK